MDGDNADPVPNVAADPADRSLAEDLRLLAKDARVLAEAEIAYQKSRATALGGGLGKVAGLGALALLLVCLALIALTVGILIALVPYLTAWGATAAMTLGLLLLAGISALWAKSRWTKLADLVAEKDSGE